MRSRHVVLLSTVALTGLLAGCGGGSVAYDLPETTPVLTAPPSGGTATTAGTSTTGTSTTSTTSTTATTPAASTDTGGAAVTPTPVTTTPVDTGGATPTPEPTTPTETTDAGDAGGADFNQFCEENPGAC